MRRHRLGLLNRNQRGFTLIELAIAMAISSAIGGGVLLSIYQVSSYQAMDRARMTCVKQVENAIHYIVRDVQMAQTAIDYDDPATADVTEFFVLSWTEWNKDDDSNIEHEVIYSIDNNELKRSHYQDPPGATSELTVARYIDSDSDNTNCGYAGGVLSLELTAAITGFPKEISETREVEITMRPDW